MRLRGNNAGNEVKVLWKDEAFECVVSASDPREAYGVRAARRRFCVGARIYHPCQSGSKLPHSKRFATFRRQAFTLIELLVVMVIIGILAAVALPHLGGFGRSNSMIAATHQLLDDVALARQKALLNRTTVYMVFLPPRFWDVPNLNAFGSTSKMGLNQMTNLFTGQYTMYSLLMMHSVGDQPGRNYPKYLTPWRRLPDGVTIAQEKFGVGADMTVTNSSGAIAFTVRPFATNSFPFPSVEAASPYYQLPYIAFTSSGGLATTSMLTNQDDYIALTRASVFYQQDANGVPQAATADWVETPRGSSTNDYHLIHINWLTGRAKLERKEIQ